MLLVLSAPAADARPQQADSSRTQALYQQAERALSERRYADAAQAYQRLQQLQPGVAEVHARLGLIYFQQGRFAEAVAPLQRALKLNPALPNVDSLLAMSLSEIGRHDEALPALEEHSASSRPIPLSGVWPVSTCSGPTPTWDAIAMQSPWRSS